MKNKDLETCIIWDWTKQWACSAKFRAQDITHRLHTWADFTSLQAQAQKSLGDPTEPAWVLCLPFLLISYLFLSDFQYWKTNFFNLGMTVSKVSFLFPLFMHCMYCHLSYTYFFTMTCSIQEKLNLKHLDIIWERYQISPRLSGDVTGRALLVTVISTNNGLWSGGYDTGWLQVHRGRTKRRQACVTLSGFHSFHLIHFGFAVFTLVHRRALRTPCVTPNSQMSLLTGGIEC